ncbi:hypothetical protein V565_185000 [Rhizoctonia solani 123E]|uniref:Uncharacterized protein n=1 Tax=Rhizoctonia solani 123E TaxID=1423351 RepID=A0A074RMY6_9AGAM|nr:hypothetical protein V565_185000 [Rhizoctonia solani 123E]
MSEIISHETSEYWGLTVDHYPRLYQNDALSTLTQVILDDEHRGLWRQDALRTMEDICMLSDPKLDLLISAEIHKRVTLEKLKLVHKLSLNVNELDNFALSRLVAGCVILLLSVKPSPLYFEYGYLCFRIMVISLNFCLLRYAYRSDPDAREMHDDSDDNNISLLNLWTACAGLLRVELTGCAKEFYGSSYAGPPGHWNITLLEQPKFEELLNVLHTDQKNLTIALKGSRSLGLSSFMYVLWKFIETKRAVIGIDEYQERFLKPYSRILYRCFLVLPRFKSELSAAKLVSCLVDTPEFMLVDSKPVDLEDSRNMIQAYTRYLKYESQKNALDVLQSFRMLAFVTPLVTPGCDDLIPDAFKATMQTIWQILLAPRLEPIKPAETLEFVLQCLWVILTRLEPSFEEDCPEPWIFDLTKSIITSDLVGIMLRVALYATSPTNERARQKSLSSSTSSHSREAVDGEHMLKTLRKIAHFSMDIMSLIPDETLEHRLRESGSFRDWRKYLTFFGSYDLFDPLHINRTTYYACTFWVGELCGYVLGEEWKEEMLAMQTSAICGNPRCPFPFGAEFGNGGVPYCNMRCQAM